MMDAQKRSCPSICFGKQSTFELMLFLTYVPSTQTPENCSGHDDPELIQMPVCLLPTQSKPQFLILLLWSLHQKDLGFGPKNSCHFWHQTLCIHTAQGSSTMLSILQSCSQFLTRPGSQFGNPYFLSSTTITCLKEPVYHLLSLLEEAVNKLWISESSRKSSVLAFEAKLWFSLTAGWH